MNTNKLKTELKSNARLFYYSVIDILSCAFVIMIALIIYPFFWIWELRK